MFDKLDDEAMTSAYYKLLMAKQYTYDVWAELHYHEDVPSQLIIDTANYAETAFDAAHNEVKARKLPHHH
jgi:hypothetical protein